MLDGKYEFVDKSDGTIEARVDGHTLITFSNKADKKKWMLETGARKSTFEDMGLKIKIDLRKKIATTAMTSKGLKTIGSIRYLESFDIWHHNEGCPVASDMAQLTIMNMCHPRIDEFLELFMFHVNRIDEFVNKPIRREPRRVKIL